MPLTKKIFAVMGASGKIGGQVVRRLLEGGMVEIRAIGRNASKMKPHTDRGAIFYESTVDNPTTLTQAFKGANGVFVMIPPDSQTPSHRQYQNKVADTIAEAIRASGVKHAVALSSVGAHNAEGVGPVKGLHDFEERLKKLTDVNVMILRPAYFMENFYYSIPLIQTMGIAGSTFVGNVPMPMIATRDIGDKVVRFLSKLDFKGHGVNYALGQRDLTLTEATKILGESIGKKDLNYVQFPPEQAKAAMLQMGMSEDFANAMIEMGNAGKLMMPEEPRSLENTTPTSIEEFAKEFAVHFGQLSKASV